MTWRIGSALSQAQLQATLTLADTGAGNARVRLYTTDRPATLGSHSDTPQADVVLAKPCGAIVGGVLVLYPLDAAGTLVMAAGLPRWGEWVSANGAVLLDGTVTDMDNGGDIRVEGAQTPAGETSPMFYAGGLVQLGTTALT